MTREQLIEELRSAADQHGYVHLEDDSPEGRQYGRGQTVTPTKVWFNGREYLAVESHPYLSHDWERWIGRPEEIADRMLSRQWTVK